MASRHLTSCIHVLLTVVSQAETSVFSLDLNLASVSSQGPSEERGHPAVIANEERTVELSGRRGEMLPWLLVVFLGGGLPGVCGTVSVNRGGYPSFSDEIPFKITWPGPEFTLVGSLLVNARYSAFVEFKGLKSNYTVTLDTRLHRQNNTEINERYTAAMA